MDDLIAFMHARLDEDQTWAEACQGHHWQWVHNETDAVVTPEAGHEYLHTVDEHGDERTGHLSLRSVETKMSEPFPRPNGLPPFPPQPMPISWPIYHCEDVKASAADHIIRHDPARVLREVEADRRTIDECAKYLGGEDNELTWHAARLARRTLLYLAQRHADHDCYQEEWRL